MKKLEKIERQEQKTREKIAALQGLLKQIDGARTEQENLQIIKNIRALNLSRDVFYDFLRNNTLPASLVEALGGADTAEPETIYTQRGKSRKDKRAAENGGNAETETPDFNGTTNTDGETPNNESEGINHEEQ